MINSVSVYLSVPPAANATSIVTGNECESTNVLLQQLALACDHYLHVDNKIVPTAVVPTDVPVVSTNTTTTNVQLSCCITSFLLEVSSDGETYRPINESSESQSQYSVGDLSSGDALDIDVDLGNEATTNSTNTAKYIRFYPLTWENTYRYDNQDTNIESVMSTVSIPAMRISVNGSGGNLNSDVGSDDTPGNTSFVQENSKDSFQKSVVDSVLSNLKNSISVILNGLDYLNKLDENKKVRKNEEIKQVKIYMHM